MPDDPEVVSGVLSNGMHYYIRQNNEPQDRASFYFAQNVGSVLEKESQRGLAHFLEHMAFNGSAHYDDKGMLQFLEKHGVKFGNEINAFTSFDITVYNISKVPTDEAGVLDSVLLILHDWSGDLLLKDEEIDKERGVINEEWRTRNTPNFRASEKIWTQGIMKGSPYEHRMPIGLMEVVNNFEYQELRDYYVQWYRPDQQAVIVVGDVDVAAMEQKVKDLFSQIPLKEGLPKRPVFSAELDDDLTFIQSEDKELGDPMIEFYVRNHAENLTGTAYVDDMLVNAIASFAINERLQEMVRDPQCPAQYASFSNRVFVRPIDVLSMRIQPKSRQMTEALGFAVKEVARFAAHGPTTGELERAKATIKSNYITKQKNQNKISSDQYARDLYQHFFDETPLPSLDWEVDYMLDKMTSVSADMIQQYVASKFGYENIVIGIKGRDDVVYPPKSAYESVLEAIKAATLEPYEEEEDHTPLISDEPEAGLVVSTFEVDGVAAKGYQLSNGAQLVLYPTGYDKDKIYFNAASKGGVSLLATDMLPSAQVATSVAQESGLGAFTRVMLDKKLAGTNTSISPRISELGEGFSGQSSTTDIEILLQQLYLSFAAPRFDQDAYQHLMQRVATNLTSKDKNVKSTFMDSVAMAMTGRSERTMLFNQQLLDEISFEKVEKVYLDRFSNVGDFTFVFVGDFEEEALLPLLLKYVGGIRGTDATEGFVDHHLVPAEDKSLVHITREMETPQTSVNIHLQGPMKYQQEAAIKMGILGQLLSKKYLDIIREQEGGSYGVRASGHLQQEPSGMFTVSVRFDCNPEKAEGLVAVVYEEFAQLTKEVDAEDLKEVKESLIKQRNEVDNNNRYWLSVINAKLARDKPIMSKEAYAEIVNSITAKDLMKVAKVINKKSKIVEGILMPQL